MTTTATLNHNQPFVDWYLMPEAFSSRLIENAIEEYGIRAGETILDPFCGTGTTLVAAKLNGCNSVGIEVNPFLCFASRVKTRFDEYDLVKLSEDADQVLSHAKSVSGNLTLFSPKGNRKVTNPNGLPKPPDMPRLFKWISPAVVDKVLALKQAIASIKERSHRDFFLLALAAILRPVSNMKLSAHAFGSRVVRDDAPVVELFESKVLKMLSDLKQLPPKRKLGKVEIIEGDIRSVNVQDSPLLPASLAITSPPYLNNLDYTMQTRLELFFLDFIKNMQDLRALRKRMIVSDAKAMYKDSEDYKLIDKFMSIKRVIRELEEKLKDKNWGWDYAFMTAQYFGGMYRALKNVYTMLRRGSRFIIVVGDSAHSGVLVPVTTIIGELGEDLGYKLEEIRVHRKRRTSSHNFELQESSVILKKT
jgi:DNA modification methylase